MHAGGMAVQTAGHVRPFASVVIITCMPYGTPVVWFVQACRMHIMFSHADLRNYLSFKFCPLPKRGCHSLLNCGILVSNIRKAVDDSWLFSDGWHLISKCNNDPHSQKNIKKSPSTLDGALAEFHLMGETISAVFPLNPSTHIFSSGYG